MPPATQTLIAPPKIVLLLAMLSILPACTAPPSPPSATPSAPASAPASIPAMTEARLQAILGDLATEYQADGNVLQFTFRGTDLTCISDQRANRMRILAPIMPASELEPGQLEAMLQANFHTALDARYAMSNGLVYALFLHPLDSLTEDDVKLAAFQVANLALTFGTDYSGGTLVFPGTGAGDSPGANGANGTPPEA
ncbi:MAG: hypothetical protein AAGK14_07895 [Verrucomicrobiota bacterium]